MPDLSLQDTGILGSQPEGRPLAEANLVSRAAKSWVPPQPRHQLAQISRRALEIACLTPFSDARDATAWIYMYGTRHSGSDAARRQRKGWLPATANDYRCLETRFELTKDGYWFGGRTPASLSSPPLYKLYVSPDVEAMHDVCHEVMQLLLEHPVAAFKTAMDLDFLRRPDKIILYFHDDNARADWLRELLSKINGASWQGTPFTEQLGDSPLTSIAKDPMPRPDCPAASWRSWCAGILGQALIEHQKAGKACNDGITHCLHALARNAVDVGSFSLESNP